MSASQHLQLYRRWSGKEVEARGSKVAGNTSLLMTISTNVQLFIQAGTHVSVEFPSLDKGRKHYVSEDNPQSPSVPKGGIKTFDLSTVYRNSDRLQGLRAIKFDPSPVKPRP